MKNILFALGHPAHYHLYKNVIKELSDKSFNITVVISDKDILKKLLDQQKIKYFVIAEKKANETIFEKFFKLIKSSIQLNTLVKLYKPDLMVGCLTQIGIVGWINNIPTLFNAEDDINYTYLQALITYPFIKHIVSPFPTKVSIFDYKKIGYDGYQKLAYLHPKRFAPDKNKIAIKDKRYFIIRLSKLNAYHDINVSGLSDDIVFKIINLLKTKGEVLITSERAVPEEFKDCIFIGNPQDMHHNLAFADLYIGDSQSMAVEAALLGTPGIRFNKFADKISIINELQKKYQLTTSINSSEPDKLLAVINDLLHQNDVKEVYTARAQIMLKEKIDVTAFFVWLIESYPSSFMELKRNNNIQNQFK